MPIGIIINALSIVIGGILGAFVGHKLSPKFKEDITLVFGVCSMGMGISTIGLMENMPAVIFSVVIGTGIGLAIHLGERINAGAGVMQRVIGKFIKNSNSELSEDEFMNTLVTISIILCKRNRNLWLYRIRNERGSFSADLQIYSGFIYSSYFCLQPGNGSVYDRHSAGDHFPDSVLCSNGDFPADYTGHDQ